MIDEPFILQGNLAAFLLRNASQHNPHLLKVNHSLISLGCSGSAGQEAGSVRLIYGPTARNCHDMELTPEASCTTLKQFIG